MRVPSIEMEVRLIGLCETIPKELSQSKKTEEQTTGPWRSVSFKEWLKKVVQKTMRRNILRGMRDIELYKVRK